MAVKSANKRTEGLKKSVDKVIIYAVLSLVVLLVFSLSGSISKIKNVALKIEKQKEKVEELKKENEKLEKDLEIARSEEFIEKQLRDKLRLAKEGEIIVILPDADEVKKFAPRMDEEEEILPDPNWKKWMKLFL